MPPPPSAVNMNDRRVPAPRAHAKAENFVEGDHVVYPTHGVGKIMRIEEQEVAGMKMELFVITFDKDKMTLRVPTAKAKAVGMRKLSSSAGPVHRSSLCDDLLSG